ncbi:hypothetical protein A2U01_0094863, partial [Trifolium medium]|nr:hypothetical protein [Trifolium medium]
EITGAAEKVFVAETVVGDEWVSEDESDRAESGSCGFLFGSENGSSLSD